MAWTAVKRSGKYIFAGFSEKYDSQVGDVVEAYDEPQDSIVAEIKANRKAPLTAQALRDELVAKGVL